MRQQPSDGPAKAKARERLRFGVRSLLVVFTLACLAIGWGSLHWYRNYRHNQAVDAVKKLGGVMIGAQDGKVARVHLANPEIGNPELVQLLGQLRYIRGLEELDLVKLPITDDVANQFYGFPNLKKLYLFETELTPDAVDGIAAAMPHVVVSQEAPDPVATRLAATNIYRHALVALAVRANSSEWVTGSGDGKLRWWGRYSRVAPQPTEAHDTWLFTAAFHPGGNRLVTGGGDDLLQVWDVSSRRQVQTLAGHDDDVHAIGFSPDGSRMYSAGDDMTLRWWDFTQLDAGPKVMGRHDEQIPCLAVHPRTGEVLTGSRDDTIGWWDAASGERLRTLEDHEADVMSLAFTRDGRLLASASYDGSVRLRSGENGGSLATFDGPGPRLFDVTFDSSGQLIATCGMSGVTVWDVESRLPVLKYNQIEYASAVAFANADRWLLAIDAKGFVHVIDARNGKQVRKVATARAYQAAR